LIKILAFEQVNLPGTVPSAVKDENGNAVKKAAAKNNYFLFLSFRKTTHIRPLEVFIKGTAFRIKETRLRETPVLYIDSTVRNNPLKAVLVPAAEKNVIELIIEETTSQPERTSSIQRLSMKNDIVVSYIWNKKKYFAALRNLAKSTPVNNE
jgi:hypothetical protein